jgi:hypothetical protein
MKTRKTIENLLIATGPRGSGRTTAMINGAKNTENCVIVVRTEAHVGIMQRKAPGVKVVSLENIWTLAGTVGPVLFDRDTLEFLLRKAMNELTNYEAAYESIRFKLKEIGITDPG